MTVAFGARWIHHCCLRNEDGVKDRLGSVCQRPPSEILLELLDCRASVKGSFCPQPSPPGLRSPDERMLLVDGGSAESVLPKSVRLALFLPFLNTFVGSAPKLNLSKRVWCC